MSPADQAGLTLASRLGKQAATRRAPPPRYCACPAASGRVQRRLPGPRGRPGGAVLPARRRCRRSGA